MSNDSQLPDCSWYLWKNDQRFGPITTRDLRKYIGDKLLVETDFVWQPGFSSWAQIKDVPSLSARQSPAACQFHQTPPPLPRSFLARVEEPIIPPPLPQNFGQRQRTHASPFAGSSSGTDAAAPNMQAVSPTEEGLQLPPNATSRNKTQANYVARHWRGQMPLVVSFWFNGLVGFLLATVILASFPSSQIFATTSSQPPRYFRLRWFGVVRL
jgi:hypothetical protein